MRRCSQSFSRPPHTRPPKSSSSPAAARHAPTAEKSLGSALTAAVKQLPRLGFTITTKTASPRAINSGFGTPRKTFWQPPPLHLHRHSPATSVTPPFHLLPSAAPRRRPHLRSASCFRPT